MFAKQSRTLRNWVMNWLGAAKAADTLAKHEVDGLRLDVCELLAAAKTKATVANTRALSDKINKCRKDIETLSGGMVKLDERLAKLSNYVGAGDVDSIEEMMNKMLRYVRDEQAFHDREYEERKAWADAINLRLAKIDAMCD